MKIKKCGFTLAEVLIAMAIIGVIAALTIPVLLSNIFDRAYVNQAKNIVGTIEQLAADELVDKKTRFLSSTDFSNASSLLHETHFESSEICAAGCGSPTGGYNSIANHNGLQANPFGATRTLRLNNGVMLTYVVNGNDNPYGTFTFDVNGMDKPNIIGRDIFRITIDIHGHIVAPAGTIADCRAGNALACTGVIMNNGWRIPDGLD